MTDAEKDHQRKEVIADVEESRNELANQTIKLERAADSLERLTTALRTHPQLVTGTPRIGDPDYRDDLRVLDRQLLLADCAELDRFQNRLRTTERGLRLLNGRSKQAIADGDRP